MSKHFPLLISFAAQRHKLDLLDAKFTAYPLPHQVGMQDSEELSLSPTTVPVLNFQILAIRSIYWPTKHDAYH